MNWGADELCHRSAELSGWTTELRAADPENVDDSVPGAVAFAAATSADADGSTDDGSPGSPSDTSTRTCGFCRTPVPATEARDADGYPVGGFEWLGGASGGETESYHRECVEVGEGRFLVWTASGVLADDRK